MSEELDKFGQLFIEEIRDVGIKRVRALISGTLKADPDRVLHAKLAQAGHKETLEEFGVYIVNHVMFNILWFFEDHKDFRLIGPSGRNLADESDGLQGELFTEDGWIARFSDDKRGM